MFKNGELELFKTKSNVCNKAATGINKNARNRHLGLRFAIIQLLGSRVQPFLWLKVEMGWAEVIE